MVKIRRWPDTPTLPTPHTSPYRRCHALVILAKAPVNHQANARTSSARTEKNYHRALISEQELADREDVERASDDEDDFENDGSVLLQIAHTDPSDGSISDHSSQRPRRDRTSITSLRIDENEVSQDLPPAKSPSQEVEMEAPTQQHIHHRRLTGTHQLSMLMDRKWGSCQK